jgi:FixJ family two-component response regulator
MQQNVPKPQVILIEDDQSLRFMLCQTLNRYGFATLDFGTPAEFFAWFAQTVPPKTCLLLDMRLPAMSGLEVQARLLASGAQFSIVFMSGDSHIGEAIVGMKQGAVDFLLKPFDETSLIKAIKQSLSDIDQTGTRANPYQLTARESLILDYISEGLKSEEIARTLNLTVRTIKMHRSNILHKTGSRTITEAVLRVHAPISVSP